MKKDKKTLTGTNVGIIGSIIGMITSTVLIVLNYVEHDSMATGIVLLCACTVTLLLNLKNKKG